MMNISAEVERALDGVGQILHAEGFGFAIVVIGGAVFAQIVDHVKNGSR